MSWSEFLKCFNCELLTSGAVSQGATVASKFCWHPAVYSLGYRKCPIICEHCFPSVIVKLTCDAHVIPYLDSVVQTCIMIVVSCREKFGCFTLTFKCNEMRAKQRNLENNSAWVIDCRYLRITPLQMATWLVIERSMSSDFTTHGFYVGNIFQIPG